MSDQSSATEFKFSRSELDEVYSLSSKISCAEFSPFLAMRDISTVLMVILKIFRLVYKRVRVVMCHAELLSFVDSIIFDSYSRNMALII